MSPAGKLCGRVLLAGLSLALLWLPGQVEARKAAGPSKDQQEWLRQAEERLRRDVTFLASDECEGRGPTTEGINRAADHIAAEFKKAGLQPGFKGSYFQPFTLPGAVGKVLLSGPAGKRIDLQQRVQFLPLGYDQKGEATGGVVFVGHGITTKNPPYDDYAGVDVKDKIVVVLRDTPKNAKVSREMKGQAPFVRKLEAAKRNGAVGVVFINDAETASTKDFPADLTYSSLYRGAKGNIPSVAVVRDVVQSMMPAGKSLADIEKGIDRDLKPNSFELQGWTIDMEATRKQDGIALKNIVGVLEGHGPLATETVIVGAHYDHLGFGGPSSLSQSKQRAIHRGADDNASGSTAMMELARRFAAMPNRQGRRLVFMAFSGEELGLFGSQHYCKNPIFDLKSTAAMYNLDMVGRLRNDPKSGQGKLLTEGHGTAKPFKELIDGLAAKYHFTLSSQAGGFGPSDHASFCEKKIPVLFVWTGLHDDYHRPTDTADRINVAGMRRVVDMSQEAITSLTKMEKPAYVAVMSLPGLRPTSGPRLGIRPSYSSDKTGLEVDGVVAGGIAEKAGMKAGDVIVTIAGKPVKDIGSYMQAMSTQKKGATIEIIVVRKGNKTPLKAKLE
jgi:hypothetical protein